MMGPKILFLILKAPILGFYGFMSLVWGLQWWRSDLWLLVPPAWLGRRSGHLEHGEALEANSTEFSGGFASNSHVFAKAKGFRLRVWGK